MRATTSYTKTFFSQSINRKGKWIDNPNHWANISSQYYKIHPIDHPPVHTHTQTKWSSNCARKKIPSYSPSTCSPRNTRNRTSLAYWCWSQSFYSLSFWWPALSIEENNESEGRYRRSIGERQNFFVFWNFLFESYVPSLYPLTINTNSNISLSLLHLHILCKQSNGWIGARWKHPRLCWMPHHIENAELFVRLMCLQFLQRNNQWIL